MHSNIPDGYMENDPRRFDALRRRLALEYQPVQNLLAKGLDLVVQPEAAVYCTSTVETCCFRAMELAIAEMQLKGASKLPEFKVAARYIQLALRKNEDFALLLKQIEPLAIMLNFFLERTTARTLHKHGLLDNEEIQRFEKNDENDSDSSQDEAATALQHKHDRVTQSEWKRRKDDPFQDIDFALVMKCVNPAYSLAHDTISLFTGFVRELLNGICEEINFEKIQERIPQELQREDVEEAVGEVLHGTLLHHCQTAAMDCIRYYHLESRKENVVTIKFRKQQGNVTSMPKECQVRCKVPLENVLATMCAKFRVEMKEVVFVYRGQVVAGNTTPAQLLIPSGATVFLVPAKWWDHQRREDARRGMLPFGKSEHVSVKRLKERAPVKVPTVQNTQVLRFKDETTTPSKRNASQNNIQHSGKNGWKALNALSPLPKQESSTSTFDEESRGLRHDASLNVLPGHRTTLGSQDTQETTLTNTRMKAREAPELTLSPSFRHSVSKVESPWKNTKHRSSATELNLPKKEDIEQTKTGAFLAMEAAQEAAQTQFLQHLLKQTDVTLVGLQASSQTSAQLYSKVRNIQTDILRWYQGVAPKLRRSPRSNTLDFPWKDTHERLQNALDAFQAHATEAQTSLQTLLYIVHQWEVNTIIGCHADGTHVVEETSVVPRVVIPDRSIVDDEESWRLSEPQQHHIHQQQEEQRQQMEEEKKNERRVTGEGEEGERKGKQEER